MNYPFPQQNKQYTQTGRGNIFGNIWSSMGIDLQENPGAVRLSTRFQVLTKTGDANATSLGCAVGFRTFLGQYWTVAGNQVYNNGANGGLANSAFVADTSTSFSTDYNTDESDIEVFNQRIWVTAPTQLRSNSGSSWTDRQTLSSGIPHMLSTFIKYNRLYFTNGSVVGSIDTADLSVVTGDYTLTIDADYSITCIRGNSQSLWVGTVNLTDATGPGIVYEWDGISAQPTNQYKLKGRSCDAIVIFDDVPYVIDNNGIFSEYSGTSFIEVGRLPNKIRLANANRQTNIRFIHPNGMGVTKNDTVLAFVNNLNTDGSIDENLPSGLWEYAKDIGFTHKKPLTYNPYGSLTITDFGQNRISRAGGIAITTDIGSAGLQTVMVGATYFTDASNTLSGIFVENTTDTVQKKGYMVTTFMEAQEMEENWGKIWSGFRRFLDPNDEIVIKSRNTEISPIEANITWVNTDTFTTSTDVTTYGPSMPGSDGITGGEVEITQGTGGASCAHIIGVANNAGTFTVTLDESVTGVTTGTAIARFQKWIKVGVIPYSWGIQKSWQQLAISNSNDSRIQVKMCFTYTGAGEFYRSTLVSSVNFKITQ